MRSLFTIGHSRRSLDELVELLKAQGVTQLVDVRHFPRSRRNPPFTMERLAGELKRRGITYVWEGETLGGLRAGGFRAYMKTSAFAAGLARLERLADQQPTAIMCAEALPDHCHRRFIARQMAARGYRVAHIVTRGKPEYVDPLSADPIHDAADAPRVGRSRGD